MDYYKCESCGKIFDDSEMNFAASEVDKKCLCNVCRNNLGETVDNNDYDDEFWIGGTVDDPR